jgi:hypothetical protein
MSARKFASLTPELLVVRKGEATPSILVPAPTRSFPSAQPAMRTAHAEERHHRWPPAEACACAAPSDAISLVPGSTAFLAVKNETGLPQLSRMARQIHANAVVVPVDVVPNKDGTVDVSIADSAETFAYTAAAAGWVGSDGAFISGKSNLFDQTNGWSLVVSLEQDRFSGVEICRHETRQAVVLGGFA